MLQVMLRYKEKAIHLFVFTYLNYKMILENQILLFMQQ